MEYLLDINNIDENTLHNIKIHSPTPIQGGSYLAKITLNDNPLLFQMPKCSTKRGVVSSGKRYYCDLLFNYDHNNVIEFIENVETTVRDKVFEKNELWFQDPPSLEDIEYNWNDSIKQTKQNFYLRTYVGNVKNVEKSVSVYNSNQEKISIDSILPTSNIITIIEITGLKFSSSSFHINYCLRQIMVLEEKKPLFNKCLINITKPPSSTDTTTQDELPPTTLTIDTTPNEDLEETTQVNDTDKNHIINDNNNDNNNNNNTSASQTQTQPSSTIPTSLPTSSDLENKKGEIDDDNNDLEILAPEVKKTLDTMDTHEQYPDSDPETEASDTTTITSSSNLEETNENINKDTKSITDADTKLTSTIESNTTRTDPTTTTEPTKNTTTDSQDIDDLEIKEVDLQIPEEEEMFQLKKPDTVYLDMYRQALEKAKDAKIKAIQAYLELKEIKNKYMIQEVDEDDDNFSDLNLEF